MVAQTSVEISTGSRVELVDITEHIERALRESGLRRGVLHIYVPHTTAALLVNENESGLLSDLSREVRKLVDWQAEYSHNRIDNNAPAHLSAALLGPSLSLPVADSRLLIGTWQSIFFVEFDGPRNRWTTITVIGE